MLFQIEIIVNEKFFEQLLYLFPYIFNQKIKMCEKITWVTYFFNLNNFLIFKILIQQDLI